MPSHPERVRTASLPEGYQFGDAALLGREAREFFERRKARFIEAHGLAEWDRDRQARELAAMERADRLDDEHDECAWHSDRDLGDER